MLAKEQRHEHQHRRHEERDLQARPESDFEAQVHLVFERHLHRYQVLGYIADDGYEDDADEELAQPELRGHGIGTALLARLANLAVERDCGRLEWSVLDWNEPSIGFYRNLGAVAMDEWTGYRLTGEALERLAATTAR